MLRGKVKKLAPPPRKKGIDDRPDLSNLPEGRVSWSPESSPNIRGVIEHIGKSYRVVSPQFIRDAIPVLRALVALNPDISQALDNVVSLANPGHKVYFDRKVPTDQVDAMRNHLTNKRMDWAPGQAGIDGLVNKWLSQIMVSGALSNEWVPNSTLTGIEANILLDPENIVFKLDSRQTKYEPYQRVLNGIIPNSPENLIKLNTNTYRYYSLTGDGESPYAIPPYLPVIPRIQTQNRMNTNIDFIVDTMGLIGFLEVLIQKPTQTGALSSATKYKQELDNLLKSAKDKVLGGLKDGVVVGFDGDHHFNFNTAAKNFDGVTKLYQENELQIASAAKQDASLWGRGYSTSETQITVVFMKLISQLKNIQNLVKANLEFGYGLELKLAGFRFDNLKVVFNRTTLTDDLKFQQAEEIKIRNTIDKFVLGIIDLDMAADELGYETPAELKPLVPIELLAGGKPEEPAGTKTQSAGKKKEQGVKKRKSESDSKKKTQPVEKRSRSKK